MKLNAKQVNALKAAIEGNDDTKKLYNRLKWDKPKTIRLNIIEKDIIESLSESKYESDNNKRFFKTLIKDRIVNQKKITRNDYNIIYEALNYYSDYLCFKDDKTEKEKQTEDQLFNIRQKVSIKCF
jgi:hypothetical protein